MLRQIALFLVLMAGAVALWFAGTVYPADYLDRGAITFAAVAAIYFFYAVLTDMLASRAVKDAKTRYTFKKAVFIISVVVLCFALIRVWVDDTQSLVVSYGILAAGLAIALQDFFRNFVGGIMITLSGMFRVGDRIEAGGVIGDVMDIGIFNTTILEIRGWVDGDQPTGRISIIPNGFAISGSVHNYTKDHNFIWDEISLPITYESDWKEAAVRFYEVLRRETEELSRVADAEIERIGEKYYLPRKVTEPAVFLSVTDNWVMLDMRYVTDVRNRRAARDRISRLLLEEVEKSDRITIASENMEVSGRHVVKIEP
jgi:small-conductance mechanosensitive channel